jgi:phospholipase C
MDAAPAPPPEMDAGPPHREPLDAAAATLDAARDPDPAAEDPHGAERLACQFARGARARDTLGDLTAARRAITHLVVIMQENRSFDHLFGTVGHGTDGIPAGYSNKDANNAALAPFALGAACAPDLPHGWAAMHAGWNNGAMDGWARTNGRQAMSHLVDADHPFYSWLATTFATADRYFASVLGPTHPNRAYLYGGTSDGLRESYAGYPRGPFVFDALDAAGVGWAEFNASPMEVFSGTLPGGFRNVRPYAAFLPGLRAGTLPPVSFVDLEPHDEHPPGSVHAGEVDVQALVAQAFASPLWPHLAILFTYDEGGGFFDHVPPPTACLAAPSESAFDHLGGRVPFILVSPYARAAFVSHQTHSHTSILRLIEAIYDLSALTGRDANSDGLLDMFDFGKPSFLAAPAAVPAPGRASCP